MNWKATPFRLLPSQGVRSLSGQQSSSTASASNTLLIETLGNFPRSHVSKNYTALPGCIDSGQTPLPITPDIQLLSGMGAGCWVPRRHTVTPPDVGGRSVVRSDLTSDNEKPGARNKKGGPPHLAAGSVRRASRGGGGRKGPPPNSWRVQP